MYLRRGGVGRIFASRVFPQIEKGSLFYPQPEVSSHLAASHLGHMEDFNCVSYDTQTDITAK